MTLLMIRIPGTCPLETSVSRAKHLVDRSTRNRADPSGSRSNSTALSASLPHNLLSIVSGWRLKSVSNPRRARSWPRAQVLSESARPQEFQRPKRRCAGRRCWFRLCPAAAAHWQSPVGSAPSAEVKVAVNP